jgi:branched-chain amino acid transport system substrate-binding protein
MRSIKTTLLAAAAIAMLGAASAHADITIATAGPMTGQYASFGEQMRRGAEKSVTTPAIPSRPSPSPTKWPARESS